MHRRVTSVSRYARGDCDVRVPAAPAQPRVLHHVLREAEIAEHAVGVRHQQRAMRFEGVEIGGGRVRHQNGLTSISAAIAAISADMP